MDFGKQFTWGSATSSFQIEGGFDKDGRGASIWDEFTNMPGKVVRGHSGAIACDHRNRYKEDVGILKQIGVNAYRFSVAWPRVMPNGTGAVSESGLQFYSDLVDELITNGITPWVTLYHWDLPWSLHLRGGWLNPEISDHFAAYTEVVVKKLGDRVKHWMTINEPQVVVSIGYGNGQHAPGYKLSLKELAIASKHVLMAHGKATRIIKTVGGAEHQVGWAPVGVLSVPATESAADIEAARQATFAVNGPAKHTPDDLHVSFWNSSWWMDPVYLGKYPKEALEHYAPYLPDDFEDGLEIIHQRPDFFSCNIYIAGCAASNGNGGFSVIQPDENMETTTMGWDVNPDALYWGARFYYERYGLPVYYTENGIAQTDLMTDGEVLDPCRIEFVRRYLNGVKRGITEGLPINGYFYWSLMDNFEWAMGYKQRFGIVHVDFKTQKRTLKSSAKWYRQVIESNGDII